MSDFPIVPEQAFRLLEVLTEIADKATSAPRGIGPHRHDFTDEAWDTFRKRPEFVHYYTKALKLVGYAYIDKDSQVDVRLKDRWQRVYFKDLKYQEDQDADEASARKKEEVSSIPPNDKLKDLEHENMILKSKIDEINANKSKAE